MQVLRNLGPGSKTVMQNFVGHLSCFDNSPPFIGGPNNAQQADGQCF